MSAQLLRHPTAVATGLNELFLMTGTISIQDLSGQIPIYFFFSGFIKSSWMQTQSIQLPRLLIPFTRMFNETGEVCPFWHVINSPLKAPVVR
jgi:hypothetical protein